LHIQPISATDDGEKLIELPGRHRRVDAVHGRCFQGCSGGNAMIPSAEDEAGAATSQVKRRTFRCAAIPREGPRAQVRIIE
jgi:hypothetical protein